MGTRLVGRKGKAQVGGQDLTDIRGWTFNITKDVSDVVAMTDQFKQRYGGQIRGSGTIEVLYNNSTGTGSNKTLLSKVIAATDPGNTTIKLFPNTGEGSKFFSFNAVVTSIDYTANMGEAQVFTISFVTNGAITVSIVE